MAIRALLRRLFVNEFAQRALLVGLIATLLLCGIQLRRWTWEKTRHVRFQHDIVNGFYWGSQSVKKAVDYQLKTTPPVHGPHSFAVISRSMMR